MQIGSSHGMQSDLNVTPMIDVVLVLLIIFMVITPLMEKKLPVVIPEDAPTDAPPPQPGSEPIVLSVNAAGEFSLGGKPVADLAELKNRISSSLVGRSPKVVFLEAVDDAPYDRAVLGMDTARQAGAAHIGLIDPVEPAPAAAPPGAPAENPQP